MRVVLNGHGRELEEPATVASAVVAAGAESRARGLAVAVDGEVVPRGDWERTRLADGQRVEVLRAVQGGA
ncbi:MAG: sulfur carrier protein ThiS [Thermoleophilaceae bacterium]|nr:sulfur carrier protein ThiS [Thermoleophilaceae bacterium]